MKNIKLQRKSIIEGEAAGQSVDPEVIKLAAKVENVKNDKPGASEDFVKTMQTDYQITDERSFMSRLKDYLLIGSAVGAAAGVAGGVGYLIYKIISMAAKTAWSLASKGGIYGKIALVCAVAAPIIYKLLKSRFKKDLSEGTSYKKVIEYKKLAIKKVLMESELMIAKMERIINSEKFTEADAQQTADGLIKKSEGVCSIIFGWIMKAIKSGYNFVKKHPRIACAILIIVAVVFACLKNPYQVQQIKGVLNGSQGMKDAVDNNNTRNELIAKFKDMFAKNPKASYGKTTIELAKKYDIDINAILKSVGATV